MRGPFIHALLGTNRSLHGPGDSGSGAIRVVTRLLLPLLLITTRAAARRWRLLVSHYPVSEGLFFDATHH